VVDQVREVQLKASPPVHFGTSNGCTTNNVPPSTVIISQPSETEKLLDRIRELEQQLQKMTEEYKKLEANQEDLYVALAEKTLTISELKEKLGLSASSSEDEAEEEEQ